MSKDPRKEKLKKAWRELERQKLTASIPMPPQGLRELFDHLEQESESGCDHTLRLTTEFLQKCGLDVESVVPWLCEHGGYCDCEVLANVEGKFREII
jgi:hypothetical protein